MPELGGAPSFQRSFFDNLLAHFDADLALGAAQDELLAVGGDFGVLA